MGAPTENMEYLWVVDGVQENLVDNALTLNVQLRLTVVH